MKLSDGRRLWVEQESADIAIIPWTHGYTRDVNRQVIMERLGIEMRLDNYRIEDYQAEVEQIVDSVLNELYGTERHVDVETMVGQVARDIQQDQID
jgi:hypothetical protein